MTITLHSSLQERLTTLGRLMRVNWMLVVLLCLIAAAGYIMLVSVADGDATRWARPHAAKFSAGLITLAIVAIVDIRIWKHLAIPMYLGCLIVLISVPMLGISSQGAVRWVDFGFVRLQPSEPMKVALIVMLAALYSYGSANRQPAFWKHILALILILVPAALIIRQPDLGTAVLISAGGVIMMFLSGLPVYVVVAGILMGTLGIGAILISRETSWQLLEDYQFDRIDVFFDPSLDPLGAGYHLMQSQAAFGSGGLFGAGYMQGLQSNLNFLPEKHTDFVFASLAEEFGLAGSLTILVLHVLVLLWVTSMLYKIRGQFSRLLVGGLACVFFLYFAVNMGMVTGLLPVVGVPLPLISHGGSAMLTVLFAFGLIQSAYVRDDRAE